MLVEVKLDLGEARLRFCRGVNWSSATLTLLQPGQLFGGTVNVFEARADLVSVQESFEPGIEQGSPFVNVSERIEVAHVIRSELLHDCIDDR